jgi:hypothetical protein
VAEETTTTEAAEPEEATTTTEVEPAEAGGLPTTEADAPSGAWISVRFLAGQNPEPDGFEPGSAEARVYDIEPDCDGESCDLTLNPGGDDGAYTLPDVPPVAGEPIELEANGDVWTEEYTYPDAIGCTDELDGPYLATTETREIEPVWNDEGEIIGMTGTVLYDDTLTAEGREAGCPASAEARYGYVMVAAPNDGIRDLEGYEVDGTFRQTLEVTASEGYSDPMFQVGGVSTNLPDFDIDLSGSCGGGTCDVAFSQLNGDRAIREADLTSTDGLSLDGTFLERGGCNDDDTGERIFESGAYASAGAYADLFPVWVEDGEVIAFVGQFAHLAEPTELGMTDPSCNYVQSLEGWVYLVDVSIFE